MDKKDIPFLFYFFFLIYRPLPLGDASYYYYPDQQFF